MSGPALTHDDPHWSTRLLVLIALLTLYRGLVLYFGHLDLYVDEAQYWTWAQNLTWGYYSKPPVIALLIALTTAIGGNGVFWVKCGSLLCYPLSAWLLYALGSRLFDRRIGFWSATAFLLLPGVSLSSMIISTDVPFFLCWCAALYAYWRALQDNRWRWWLMAGIASGLGLQTKYTMILFALSVLLHLASDAGLRRQFRNPRLYLTMLLAALIFIPNLWWNAVNGWPTLHHTEGISHLENGAGLHWNHLSDFLGAQFAVMGPVFFGAWLWLTLWRSSRWWNDERLRFLNLFALPFLAVICGQALLGRANANWGAMTYASATILMVAMLLQHSSRKVLGQLFVWGFAINVVMMPIAYHFDAWTRAVGITLSAHNDPFKRVRGWAKLGTKVRVLMSRYPHALILGDARDIVAELMYYDRPQALHQTLQWNPQHRVDSQYTLTDTLADKRGRNFIYLTGSATLSAEVRNSFAQAQALGPVHVQIHRDYALDYHAFLLRDFRGYADQAQP